MPPDEDRVQVIAIIVLLNALMILLRFPPGIEPYLAVVQVEVISA